jgi:hypothetical protein
MYSSGMPPYHSEVMQQQHLQVPSSPVSAVRTSIVHTAAASSTVAPSPSSSCQHPDQEIQRPGDEQPPASGVLGSSTGGAAAKVSMS